MAVWSLYRQRKNVLPAFRFPSFLSTLPTTKQLGGSLDDDDPPFRLTFAEDIVEPEETDNEEADNKTQQKWKCLKGAEAGIYHGSIPASAWFVLHTLHTNGFASYLVGGCLRDSLLKQTPKDYDIITTADLKQVRKVLPRSMTVGRRFPVCQVFSHGHVVEVTSFNTEPNARGLRNKDLKLPSSLQSGAQFCSKDDLLRWQNCMKRDFTINGFLYDPFQTTLYDYAGGLRDLEKKKVRTISQPHESFREDPARLLRGMRVVARLGFRFSRETSRAVKDHKVYLNTITQARLMQEINTMMAHGASEASLRVLWKYDYLDALLPVQSNFLQKQKFRRSARTVRRNLLLEMLGILDKCVTASSPCHTSLWVAVLAFHLGLEQKQKKSHLAVVAAALAIRSQNMEQALGEMKRFEERMRTADMAPNAIYFNVLTALDDTEVIVQTMNSLRDALSTLQQMYGKDEAEPSSNTSVISKMIYAKVVRIFDGALHSKKYEGVSSKREFAEQHRKKALSDGVDVEVNYALSCIILNVVYPAKKKSLTV